MTISITHQKKGCGKASSTENPGALLIRKHGALLVDADQQGNPTTYSGINKAEQKRTIYDVMRNGRMDEAVVRKDGIPVQN